MWLPDGLKTTLSPPLHSRNGITEKPTDQNNQYQPAVQFSRHSLVWFGHLSLPQHVFPVLVPSRAALHCRCEVRVPVCRLQTSHLFPAKNRGKYVVMVAAILQNNDVFGQKFILLKLIYQYYLLMDKSYAEFSFASNRMCVWCMRKNIWWNLGTTYLKEGLSIDTYLLTYWKIKVSPS
jgi:hypothetical protein